MESPISESRFSMWRSILAVAHETGKLTPDDRVALEASMSRKGMPAEQYKVIHDEILKPSDLHVVLEKISDDEDLAKFCEISRLFYWSDGDLDQQASKIKADLADDINSAGVAERLDAALEKSATSEALATAKAENFDKDVNLMTYVYTVFPQLKEIQPTISDSELYMWRAVFAVAHADGVVTNEEEKFLKNILKTVPFNETQRTILHSDIKLPQSIDDMFTRIKDSEHRSRFFYISRLLCWCDGDFDKQEQEIIAKLNTLNFKSVDFEQLIHDVDLSFEDEPKKPEPAPQAIADLKGGPKPQEKAGFVSKVMGKIKKTDG